MQPLKPKTKEAIYIITAVIILVVVLYLTFRNQLNSSGNQPNQSVTTTDTPVSIKEEKASVKSNTSKSASQRYLDAIKIYKNSGYYFQFVDCHGLPGSLTLKAGVKFMLDNRDNDTHKISIQGGQSVWIGAYNFAIVTAPSAIGTHFITCDGGGAAKIIVQK